MTHDERPKSVEEAGALLGAAITLCGMGATTENAPPKGMHSSFATASNVPSSDLLMRLYYLRALLRASPKDEPLVAAPSLLAVLMKLVGTSTQQAAKNAAAGTTHTAGEQRPAIPPMLSTPLRKLWVDCVVLCHRLGEGLSGPARTSLFAFLKNMMALAGMNPRSAKAGGGARVAALDVIAGLFDDESLAPKISGWTHDALQLCLRALRSSGNGEPSFRISAVKMACATAKACRVAYLTTKPVESPRHALLLPGAMEAPAVLEAIKVLRQAATDKFPEVRSAGATFAALLSPMLVLPPKSRPTTTSSSSSEQPHAPIVNLDEVIYIALKNLDDEQAEVAAGWAEALARCITTAIEVGERKASSAMAKRDVEVDQDDPSTPAGTSPAPRSSRKREGPVVVCKDLKSAILFLLKNFVKVGGELAAVRAGGAFSLGGRAVRVGFSNSLTKLLRIQSTLGIIGHENGLSVQETIMLVLKMTGVEAEKQFVQPPSSRSLDVTTLATPEVKPAAGNALFGAKNKSETDAGLVRLAAGNVIRFGISELASETTQLSLLQDLLQLLDPSAAAAMGLNCTAHQLQVILVEISHLLATLGEASASKIEDLSKNLKACLSHPNHGVRHEAAVACGAFAACFPAEGREMLIAALDDVQTQHAQLMGVASLGGSSEPSSDPKRSFGRMFRRPKKESEKPLDPALAHQYAIHGISLMVSIVVRELPHVPGGISKGHLAAVLSLAEMLVSCQFNDVIAKANPAVTCTCVRAGFGVITGLLATGPDAVKAHTKKIFELLQKSYKSSSKEGGTLSVDHDLGCVEVVLSSIVAFLSYCSILLLSVPEVLSQISIMLEELLAAFSPGGRFGNESTNPAAITRLKSAKASLMEAFAWLPSGSFPMAADNVFAFAAQQIQIAIAGEVTCSILPSMVTREDLLLDAKALTRVDRAGQVGGARDMEESMVILTSEAAQHGERESVIHFPGSHVSRDEDKEFRHSQILGMFAFDYTQPPPTPLHAAVGTWRKPLDVSCSSTVRLIDAAVQAFAATFGLKGGMEQQEAMEMLESLVPPFLTQLATSIGMTTTLTEQVSRVKPKEDNAAVANITAVLLSCLRALPLHEATHNVPIGLGPPWMNKAKDLLLTLLPSASNVVRRAAAEGLALLATLGVSEDAHFLQSAVLHSLDEVMKGNQPDGKPKTLPLEPISASRAGSLLTLACIQRMAQKVSETKMGRTRGRALSAEEIILQAEEQLPTLQMMTRILPSVARQGFRDFFIVQTHALHAFGLLLGYSSKLEKERLEAEDLQLLRKGVELIEDNFVASWTAASADFDAGQEGEKLAAEVSFLAVLLRLMALLIPSLHHIHSENPGVASRFSCMATLIMESMGSHPVVTIECMAFFEVLAGNQHLLPPPSANMNRTDNPIFSCIPFCIASLKPQHPDLFVVPSWCETGGCRSSTRGLRSVLRAVKIISLGGSLEQYDMEFASSIFAFLEATCTSRCFTGSTLHRPLAAPRAAELVAAEGLALEKEGTEVLRVLLTSKRASTDYSEGLLRWVLFCRSLVTNTSPASTGPEGESGGSPQSVEGTAEKADAIAASDAARVFAHVGQVRWQIKSLAILLATGAIDELLRSCGTTRVDSPNFNYKLAEEDIQRAIASNARNPASRLVLHLGKNVSLACTSAVAAVDKAELPTLQLAAVLLLSNLIACFRGVQDPQQPDDCILDQYATQIFASVKHSLGDPEALLGEAYFGRFFGGCQAIQTIAESELAKDPMALKRIIRPIIPSAEETPFFEFNGSCPTGAIKEEYFDNRRAVLLVRIGKLWTAGELSLMRNTSEAKANAIRKLVEDEAGLAVHSAAVAFDGARLLLGAGATLCGSKANGERIISGDHKGFLYTNIRDVDDAVKAAMAKTWSSCGCYALRTLFTIASSESNAANKQACSIWVKQLVPLMLAGLNDCLSSFGSTQVLKGPGWCEVVESSEVAVNCLYSLGVFVENSSHDSSLEELGVDMGQLLHRLLESVILPALGQHPNVSNDEQTKGKEKLAGFLMLPERRQAHVIREICELIKHVAANPLATSSALLTSILTPLDLVQRSVIECDQKHVESIISTCLIAASTLISLSKSEDSFVKSMAQVALDIQRSEKRIPDTVDSAARTLVKGCLSHKAMSVKDRRFIAHEFAEIGDWETWRVVCAIDDGRAASGSMTVLKTVLLDSAKPEQQLQALAALRQLLQTPNNVLVGRIMNEAGAEILHFFKMYGTLPPGVTLSRASKARRISACADSMKVVLVAIQQLVSDATEEAVFVAFLMVVFEYLLMVLRFNGLPNHPPPQTESDPALGRMTAQAIVHVARSAPAPFKTTLATMADANGRALLEFAVRAEMTGYANAAAQAPAKKKLSLRGFQK